MKGVNCVLKQNYFTSDINTCIQLQLNCEYHNSEFSVCSVYQFINNKYICLILPNYVNNCSYLYVPYQRGIPTRKEISYKDQTLTFASHSKKKSESCPSNQVFTVAMTTASDEKWRPLNCFFSRVGLRTYQHHCIK